MIARSVPDRALRCQPSRRVIWSGADRPHPRGPADARRRSRPRSRRPSRARRGGRTPPRGPRPGRAASRSRRARARRRRSRRSPGWPPAPRTGRPRRPRATATSSATAFVPRTRAARMMNRTRARGRPAGGTVAPSSRRRVAQISAWRRSLVAMWRKAAWRRGSLLDRGQRVVQGDRILFELEVLQALGDVHAESVPKRDRGDTRDPWTTGGSTSGCTGRGPAADGSSWMLPTPARITVGHRLADGDRRRVHALGRGPGPRPQRVRAACSSAGSAGPATASSCS